jgi:MFS family permease
VIRQIYGQPADHPSLSPYERKQLECTWGASPAAPSSASAASTATSGPVKEDSSSHAECQQRPTFKSRLQFWKRILMCGPFWATCSAKLTVSFGYYVITTKMPAYLNDTLHVPLAQNGLLCGATYGGVLVSKLYCLYSERRRPSMTHEQLTRRRKMFQATSAIIPAIAMFVLYKVPPSFEVAVAMLILAMFGMGFQVAGEFPNLPEYAGQHSPILFSVANTWACLDGMIAPLITGKVQITSALDLMSNLSLALPLVRTTLSQTVGVRRNSGDRLELRVSAVVRALLAWSGLFRRVCRLKTAKLERLERRPKSQRSRCHLQLGSTKFNV